MFRLTKDMENNITIQQWTRRERQTNHTWPIICPKKPVNINHIRFFWHMIG